MKWVSCLLLVAHINSVNASPMSIDEAWDPQISAPAIMSHYFIHKFSELPLKGAVKDKQRYWSGDYWPLNKGNINYRWYAQEKKGFNLDSPSREKALHMTVPELAQLAPTEKYDIFVGRYDYPLRKDVEKIANATAESWEGICHGWAPASMNHNEPVSQLLINKDGIEIPFGASDIKALLSYYYAYGFNVETTYQMGLRCNEKRAGKKVECDEDLNAGAFHIVLSNRTGIDRLGFIIDIKRFKEVWNHSITGYKSEIIEETRPGRKSAPGTVKVIQLKTTVSYVDGALNYWNPVIGTSRQSNKTLAYEYALDVDGKGMVIGGEWNSKLRPDFLWLKQRPRKFEGSLSRLGELLHD